MQEIYWRTSMPKCYFNKVAKQRYWNHTDCRAESVRLPKLDSSTIIPLLLNQVYSNTRVPTQVNTIQHESARVSTN